LRLPQVLYDIVASGVFLVRRINFTEFGVGVIVFLQILIVALGLTSIKIMNGRKKLGQQLRHHIESSLCFAPPLHFAAARQSAARLRCVLNQALRIRKA
jgi:hypothetical protein